MKIDERGRVTIPKKLWEKPGLTPETELVLVVRNNSILLSKRSQYSVLTHWKGYCKKSFDKSGYASVDEYIDDVRGQGSTG
jgi:bifunctional DNA-binding transcriptional regulator/antitoxin component of YhaV-PrlF toxin-antitoxin module